MQKFENKMKDTLFLKEKELNQKEKQNFKLREENIEVEKLYLSQRQQLQREKQAMFRALTKVKIDLDALRKDSEANAKHFQQTLSMQKSKNADEFKKVFN